MNLRKLSLAIPLITLFSISLNGQTSINNWDNVMAIPAGTQIRVVPDSGKELRGILQTGNAGELSLRIGNVPQTMLRPQILSVSVKKKGHRVRNAFIGLGIGLGVGIAVGFAGANNCARGSELDSLCGLAIPPTGVVGLAIGTTAGALWPTGGWKTTYKLQSPPVSNP